MNTDNDNYISENEFLLFCLVQSVEISEGELLYMRQVFSKYDRANIGKIDLKNFTQNGCLNIADY